MILYFADRQMEIIGQASTSLPHGLIIDDDKKTEDVEIGVSIFECKIPFDDSTRDLVAQCTEVGNYILRSHDNENEFYTIIETETDTKKQTVYIYAEDAGMDLLNEVVGPYEADKAYPISHYINKYVKDAGFVIGTNEVASLTRKLSWDGDATATERILSVATQFGGCELSFSFDVDGLEVVKKYVNIHKERGADTGESLRLNKEVDSIVTTKTIENLATALQCTGGTPENEENPITLKNYKYDDGDFYVDGTTVKSRQALKQWSRLLWKDDGTTEAGGHITKQFSYDTISPAELCSHAITELKKIRETAVNYEAEIKELPASVRVGDRVNIIDDAGELYLSTRLLTLETSVCDKSRRAILGEYLIKGSGISEKVEALAAKFAKNAVSAARALNTANSAKATAEAANTKAQEAAEESQQALEQANQAQAVANTAQQSAQAAEQAASNAQAAVDDVEKTVEEMEQSVADAEKAAQMAQQAAASAETKATEAHTASVNAGAKADEAKQAAETATSKADSATETAGQAKTEAEAATAKATEAATTAAVAKQDAKAAQDDIDNLGENLTTLQNTMQADYARKTDLTEANASLQTQITQNAAGIQSTATRVQEIDETANSAAQQAEAAQSAANTAQQTADTAKQDAQAAQAAADSAAQAATSAQGEADRAKAAADAAQQAADTAAEELETAKSNLESVTSRVDSTEEEIQAAQAAVTAAQQAADKAQENAEAAAGAAQNAQNTANTAATNASNAQTAADNAAQAASAAQATADAAKGDAKKAQDAADAARTAATNAQNTADTAAQNAATAQTKADEAAQAAQTAQNAADAADSKAAQAAQDLETAKQNLENVTSRVDSTEEEIAAAQEAVETAQAAADKAKQDAATAQSTANTAKTNAANAQTAADNAKSAADAAQADADKAKAAADAAQKDVDALAVRVTKTETDIVQTSEQIKLLATKEEVTQTLGGYYTKTEADAKIQLKADEISQTVRETYTERSSAVQEVHRYYATGGGSGTITWHGDTTGLFVFENACRISEAVPTASDLEKGITATLNGTALDNVAFIPILSDSFSIVYGTGDNNVASIVGAEGAAALGIPTGFYVPADSVSVSITINGYTGFAGGSLEKPTTYPPPSNWSEIEPTYTEAQSLYTTICTVYADGSFVYSDVSASAAQEGANRANAKALEIEERVTNAETAITQNAESIELRATRTELSTVETKANNAASAASNAQSTANTAKTNAATAQSTADTAKTNAANAQTAANNAQDAADAAQSDVDALKTRVATAETSISQNAEAIALRATKAEVTSALSGYYTKSQTDAQIQVKANEISQTVSEKHYAKTTSKGEQLVVNGSGILGDNTNFSAWTFDAAVANNSPGSFTIAEGVKKTVITDEFFPVSTNNEYTFSFDLKTSQGLARLYSMCVFYDVDKLEIKANNHMYVPGSTTTLAQDLKSGDTTIYLTDSSGWSTTSANSAFMIFWNYTNTKGYTYPAETYSRKRLTLPKNGTALNSANINKTAHTITLTTAYSGATIPAGTSVSQGRDGANYKYIPCSNTLIPTTWTHYSGKYSGVDYSGTNITSKFPPGCAYAKVGFLWNYNTAADQLWITNISVTDTTASSAALTAANNAQSNVDALSETLESTYATKSEVTQTANSITSTVSSTYATKAALSTTDAKADDAASAAAAAQEDATAAATAAATAQSTANTAKTNAATAQSTADTAKTNAATAQTTANNAQTAANNAQSTANTALSQTAEFITGTQTATTGSWTGKSSTITALYDGLQITYWLPYAGNGNATLNLTLADGTTTGAKNCYYRGSTRITTHFAAGSTIRLTYRTGAKISGGSTTYTGWWADGSYEGSNTYDRTRYNNAVKAAEALAKSTYLITVGTASGYKKAAAGVSFDVSYPVLAHYNTSAAVSAGGTTAYMYTQMPSVTLRNNVANWTGTQYAMAYLVGELIGNTFTIGDDVFTCATPTEVDGLAYIPIGILSSTYQIYFRTDQTVYAYGSSGFAPVSVNAQVTADDAISQTGSLRTAIEQLDESIALTVSKEEFTETINGYYTKKETDAALTMQEDAVNVAISRIESVESDIASDVTPSITNIQKYFSFTESGLTITAGENTMTLTLDNDRISFKKNGVEFGWWDGVDFHTGNIIVDVSERAQFGNFAFVPRSDGSLSFLKVGG